MRLQLSHQGSTLVGVAFAYLPALRVVTAQPVDPGHVQVLSALYPADTGLSCPSPAHADLQWDEHRTDRPYRCAWTVCCVCW